MAAIGIIAVLIALLLPALQPLRESANASRTANNLQRLCKQAVDRKLQTGKTPSLDSVWMDLAYPIAAGYALDGFALSVPAGSGNDKLELLAAPLPGITGSVTLRVPWAPADARACAVTSTPIPAADTARTEMFNDVLAAGVLAFQRLIDLGLNPSQPGLTANPVQGNYIGVNSFLAMQKTTSETIAPPVTGWFVSEAFRIMRLGANGEQWATLPSAGAIIDGTSNTVLFSTRTLETVTREFFGNATAAAGPLADLQAARTAEASGDIVGRRSALMAFRAKVILNGGSLTAPESASLISLTDVLISN